MIESCDKESPENGNISSEDKHIIQKYRINSKPRGYVLILHLKMDECTPEEDIKNLEKFWTNLQYKVVKRIGLKSIEEYDTAVKNFSQTNMLSDVDSFILFELSGNNLLPHRNSVTIEQFTSMKCHLLQEKPKLFFFRSYKTTVFTLDSRTSQTKTDGQVAHVPEVSDILVAFLNVTGEEKVERNGSLFVNAICQTFSSYAAQEHVENMLKRVGSILSSEEGYGYPVFIFENWGFDKHYYL